MYTSMEVIERGLNRLWSAVVFAVVAASAGSAPMLFDDYQFASETKTFGVFGEIGHLYATWSGRLFMNVLAPIAVLGPNVMRWAPVVVFTALVIALGAMIQRVSGGDRRLLARTLPWVVAGIPAWFQTTQWFAGSMVYAVPIVALGAGVAVASRFWARGLGHRVPMLAGALLIGMAAAGNEIFALSIPAATLAFVVMTGWSRSRLGSAILLGCVSLGAASLVFAPGSRQRASVYGFDSARAVDVFSGGARMLAIMMLTTMALPGAALFLSVRTSAVTMPAATWRIASGVTMAGTFSAIFALLVVPAITLEGSAPVRAMLPVWIWFAAGVWVWALKPQADRSDATPISPVLVGLACALAMASFVGVRLPAQMQQREFSQRLADAQRELSQRKGQHVDVSIPSQFEGIFVLTDKPDSWPNRWTASYFEVASITNR